MSSPTFTCPDHFVGTEHLRCLSCGEGPCPAVGEGNDPDGIVRPTLTFEDSYRELVGEFAAAAARIDEAFGNCVRVIMEAGR